MRTLELLSMCALAALPVACSVSHGAPATEEAAPRTSDNQPTRVSLPAASLPFVKVQAVQADTGAFSLRAPARVAFRDGAVSQVGSPTPGRVTHVYVKSGDRVRAGQPVVGLDSFDAASARTALAAAEAGLRQARAELDRATRMLDEGVGTEREKVEADAKYAAATAEADRAREGVKVLGPGTGAELVLRAPISGTVTSVRASVGLAVEAGSEALLEIGDPGALLLIADVSEHDVPLVKEGATVTAEIGAMTRSVQGHVVSVGIVVSNALRTAPVRIALDDPSIDLRPGMFGRVHIAAQAIGPTLPAEAVLIKDGRESVVYVAQGNGMFERRAVVVGQAVDGRVPVISGLAPGEEVVVQGALLLDGSADQTL